MGGNDTEDEGVSPLNTLNNNSSTSTSTMSNGDNDFLPLSVPSSVGQIVGQIPEMKIKAGPRDGAKWNERLKEEFEALIYYVQRNKTLDNDWFNIEPVNKSPQNGKENAGTITKV